MSGDLNPVSDGLNPVSDGLSSSDSSVSDSMGPTELITKFFELGWTQYNSLPEALEHPELLPYYKQMYAAFHGLSSVDGVESHLQGDTGLRICALPDTMPIGTTVCKWPDNEITWAIVGAIRSLTTEQVISGITTALGRWAKICGIVPKYTPGNPQAKILIGSRNIDGPMGVLAESELPCGAVQQCRQWYDNGESFGLYDGPGTNPRVLDFIRIATHELGHALGMNHIGAGNLLAPTYSPNVWVPQAGDIAEMQARYGPPVLVPPPSPGGGGEEIIIRVKGSVAIDGKRITDLVTGTSSIIS